MGEGEMGIQQVRVEAWVFMRVGSKDNKMETGSERPEQQDLQTSRGSRKGSLEGEVLSSGSSSCRSLRREEFCRNVGMLPVGCTGWELPQRPS